MTETTKEAQKRRLAEALRANLRRRKTAGRPAMPRGPEPERAAEPAADDGDRG